MLVNMRTQFARPPRKKDEKRGADRFFRGAPRPDKKTAARDSEASRTARGFALTAPRWWSGFP